MQGLTIIITSFFRDLFHRFNNRVMQVDSAARLVSPGSYKGEYFSHDNAALAPSSGTCTLDAGALYVSGDVSMGECTMRWDFGDNMVCHSSAFILNLIQVCLFGWIAGHVFDVTIVG